MGLGNEIFSEYPVIVSVTTLDVFGWFWLWDVGRVLSPAIIGLTEGAVFLQEMMPGPVILVHTVAADYCQTEPSQTGTENNSKRLF